jgi:Flp pilus assembly protein TadB
MALDLLREKWTKLPEPTYSRDEQESIYNLKERNLLELFKAALRADLIIAVLISSAFIILLQSLNLRYGNFWSLIMGFVTLQHIIVYSLQTYLIARQTRFTGDVANSITQAIKKLRILQWHYRVWPTFLSTGLFLIYHYLYGVSPTGSSFYMVLTAIILLVLLLSEFLSSRMLRSKIVQLEKLEKEFAEIV